MLADFRYLGTMHGRKHIWFVDVIEAHSTTNYTVQRNTADVGESDGISHCVRIDIESIKIRTTWGIQSVTSLDSINTIRSSVCVCVCVCVCV